MNGSHNNSMEKFSKKDKRGGKKNRVQKDGNQYRQARSQKRGKRDQHDGGQQQYA